MFASRFPEKLTPNRLARELAARQAEGREFFDLTASNPTTAGFHYEEKILLQAMKQQEIFRYHPSPQGNRAARQAIARYYLEHGRTVDPDDLFLTAGTSEAYSFLFKLLADPGEEILVPGPSYPLFESLIRLESLQAVPYPLRYAAGRGWHVDLEELRCQISTKTRALLAVNPNNPTGSYLQGEELHFIFGLCREYGLALVVDEVFLDYPVGDGAEASNFSVAGSRENLTFVLSGLSKIVGLPQLKLGWIVIGGPGDLSRQAKERLALITDAFLTVGSGAQLALPALLSHRRQFQDQVRCRLNDNYSYLETMLADGGGPQLLERQGGWYAIIRHHLDTDDDEELVCRLLSETGVLVHPGYFYDFQQNGYLVLSLLPPPAIFRSGARHLTEGILYAASHWFNEAGSR
jgi:alanine-synthesizing transaminase